MSVWTAFALGMLAGPVLMALVIAAVEALGRLNSRTHRWRRNRRTEIRREGFNAGYRQGLEHAERADR